MKVLSVLSLLVAIFLKSSIAFSQQNVSISGNLSDKKQAVEFATITLKNLSDSTKSLKYETSDSLGKFLFTKLDFGTYLLKANLVGYQGITKELTVSSQNASIVLNDLELIPENTQLGDLVVTAQKSLLQKTNEGFVINAASNLTQAGGTATDLLRNTPTVAVDADGAVTLRGKSPLILINGRNSNLSNTDQIAASSIESIEIITNASAKYDANAESGIINIILKKNKANGTNGALVTGLGAGSRFRINNSAIFNHKSGKWNIGLAYDNRFAGRTRSIIGDRTNYNLTDMYFLSQNRVDERYERLQNLKLNIDFLLNKANSLSFEAIGNMRGQDNDETLLSKFSSKNNIFSSGNDRHSVELQRPKVAEFAMNFNHSFADERKSLSASLSTSIENSKENTDIDTYLLSDSQNITGSPILQRTHNYENGYISNAKLDYSVPISETNILDLGYKGIFRSIKTDFETATQVNSAYVINPLASNIFNFNEQVQALYALIHSKSKSKWNYELGLRAEQVNNAGKTQDESTKFTNNYFKLFPTANLIYIVNPDQFWKLAYGKRINRPGLGQLNPFTDITDALNPHSGNPFLKPEIIHAAELSFNKDIDKMSFSSNLFYRYSKNTIRNFFQDIGNGVVLNKPMNIGSANSYGLENVLVGKLSRLYDFNASVTFFQQKLNATNIATDAIQNTFNWFGKLINNFAISKNTRLQIAANYTSAAVTPQGNLIPVYYADMGFQQKFGNGNARLGLTVVDIFNTLKSGNKNFTTDFASSRVSKADTRAIMLTFAYSFKSTVKDKMLENKFSREW